MNKGFFLEPPSSLDLGLPPRHRYPLLLLIIDSEACSASAEELHHCHHIVSFAVCTVCTC